MILLIAMMAALSTVDMLTDACVILFRRARQPRPRVIRARRYTFN